MRASLFLRLTPCGGVEIRLHILNFYTKGRLVVVSALRLGGMNNQTEFNVYDMILPLSTLRDSNVNLLSREKIILVCCN